MTPPRLIDLRIDWLAQYRGEIVGSAEPLPPERLARLDGYLDSTRAAFLIDSTPSTPPRVVDAWIARAHAEFPGRVLATPDDFARWNAEPESLCGAVLALGPGFATDRAQHTPDRLATLIDRGVRVFPAAGEPFLERLGRAAAHVGRTLAVDLADLSPDLLVPTLELLVADASVKPGLVPIVSRSTHPNPSLITRIGTSGGLVALTLPALRSALPAENPELLRWLAVATDFPVGDDPTPAAAIRRERNLDPAVLAENASRLIARLTA